MNKKTLIIFAHCVGFTENSFDNLDYFLKNGVTDDPNVTFVISQNNVTNNSQKVKIPKQNNLKYISMNVPGFAWGNWNEALKQLKYQKYDYFIFLKDSIRIPIKKTDLKWYQIMINMIDDHTKMVGSEFFIIPTKVGGSWVKRGYAVYIDHDKNYNLHVGTSIWATDQIGLQLLLPHFKNKYKKKEFIMNSQMIKNNYNIRSLESRFASLDLTKKTSTDEAKKAYLLHRERDPDNIFLWTKEREKFIYPE